MNFFFYSHLLIIISTSIMSVLMFMKRDRKGVTFFWGLLCVCATIWAVGGVNYSIAAEKNIAYKWWQFAYIGVIYAPVMYSYFVNQYLEKKQYKFLSFSFLFATFFLVMALFYRESFLGDLRWMFDQYYGIDWTIRKAPLFLLFYIYFYWILLTYSFVLLVKKYFSTKTPGEKNQLKYLLLGSMIGWLGPHGVFISYFGVRLYPFLNILLAFYPIIIGFAIIKYRLMEISVVLTRTSIFIAVYSLVLGIPFLVAFGAQEWLRNYIGEMWWMAPLILLTLLATAGPFIYLAIQRRAEEKLFQDQRRYQTTLRQAATGMGRIKDMGQLAGLIVHIVTRSVRVEHSTLFLKDASGKKYSFEGAKAWQEFQWDVKEIDSRAALIRTLKKVKQPIIYSEFKQRQDDEPQLKLEPVLKEMESLRAELVVPSFVDENLIAFLVMGCKISGDLYTDDDIAVFSILGSQAALAIENCQFYKDMRATHEQLFQAEKMATIGIMADGLSHQINNRLHALGFIAGDALDTIHFKKDIPMSDELKEVMVDLEHALTRIQENVAQGGEIVRGLLKYSRKQNEEFSEVELDELIDEALKMAQFKIRKDAMDVIRDFPLGLPRIRGNFTQLQEVFFNLIDNAYDAMMQRKEELREEGYRPTIEIKAEARTNNRMNIILRDNGIGIKLEDQVKIFTPFFTTKLSSKKGTGLGLYVIQKLIEENHKGKVVYRSEYMNGTKVYVTLPTC